MTKQKATHDKEAIKKALFDLRDAIQQAEAFGLVRTEDGTPITGAIFTKTGIVLVKE
ncbi:hypothetical protein OIX85_003898 [Vibrio parahaemolyticus]|nr:hypothetical protein [Vibrio parahaemolyticus]